MKKDIIFDVKNAAFSYSKASTVFDNISFSIKKGDVFCILGPNGIGKSTLLRCLIRLLPLKSGDIFLEGKNIANISRNILAKKVGFIPQSHSPVFSYSVFDFVLMGRSPYVNLFASPSEEDIAITEEAISNMGVSNLRDKTYTHLSGGEQQLVLFARVLAQEPSILLLDEPTSHLDLANQMHILQIIEKFASEGLTTIMTTHIPDHAILLAQRAAIMKDQNFLVTGNVSDVITEEHLQNAYGIEVKMVSVCGTEQKTCVPVKTQRY